MAKQAFQVQTKVYSGPFDILLHLIQKDQVSIADVDLASVAVQYVEQTQQLGEVDLEVASDFIFVAATLLVIKSGYFLPLDLEVNDDLLDDIPLSKEEALTYLISRLERYKQYREAAHGLKERGELEAHKFARQAPLPAIFQEQQPNYLQTTTLQSFSVIAAHVFSRPPEKDLLASNHVAPKRISLAKTAFHLLELLRTNKEVTFSKLVGQGATKDTVVVNFLAVLENLRRGTLTVDQQQPFGDITITATSKSQ